MLSTNVLCAVEQLFDHCSTPCRCRREALPEETRVGAVQLPSRSLASAFGGVE